MGGGVGCLTGKVTAPLIFWFPGGSVFALIAYRGSYFGRGGVVILKTKMLAFFSQSVFLPFRKAPPAAAPDAAAEDAGQDRADDDGDQADEPEGRETPAGLLGWGWGGRF